MKIMVIVCAHVMMIKLRDLEKKKEKNKMNSRCRVYNPRVSQGTD